MPATSEGLMKKVKPGGGVAKAVPVDQIEVLVSQIESLSRDEALSRFVDLLNGVDYNYVQIGGVLAVIRDNEWWDGEGFDNFADFVEQKLGMAYGKAIHLVKIYTSLVESEIPFSAVEDIGWTKARVICAVLNKSNVDHWVELARKLTTVQLKEEVKKAIAKAKGDLAEAIGEDPATVSDLTTMTFKVYPGQKETIRTALDSAKAAASTEADSVALEALALNFLSGGKVTTTSSLKKVMQQYTPQDVLAVFNEIWPDIVITLDATE